MSFISSVLLPINVFLLLTDVIETTTLLKKTSEEISQNLFYAKLLQIIFSYNPKNTQRFSKHLVKPDEILDFKGW